MNWQPWVCPNPCCADEIWMVQRNATIPDLWRVAAYRDAVPFTIAATAPICPHCATMLLTQTNRADACAQHTSAEEGSVFDYLRSLS
jgi:hypothetical protein